MWELVALIVAFGGFIGVSVVAQIRWQDKCSRLSLEERADRGYGEGFAAGLAGGILGMIGMGWLAQF